LINQLDSLEEIYLDGNNFSITGINKIINACSKLKYINKLNIADMLYDNKTEYDFHIICGENSVDFIKQRDIFVF
jgi:hypothetical protein